jgi:hypothetical protein
MAMLAHVLSSNVIPGAAEWGAVASVALGGLGLLRRRRHILDMASWATFGLGAAACLGMVGVGMLAPIPPGYSLSVALHTQVTSPVQVSVCAQLPSGAGTATPDLDHVLAVSVDGVQVASPTSNILVVTASRGTHTLRVELLTSGHREFNPAVAVDTTFTVTGIGPLVGWAACPDS